jgi:hypothetical protein
MLLSLDTRFVASPDAEKHISFFANTLDVDPVHNYKFSELPSTSILIPCYGEKLMFDWTVGPNYSPKGLLYLFAEIE